MVVKQYQTSVRRQDDVESITSLRKARDILKRTASPECVVRVKICELVGLLEHTASTIRTLPPEVFQAAASQQRGLNPTRGVHWRQKDPQDAIKWDQESRAFNGDPVPASGDSPYPPGLVTPSNPSTPVNGEISNLHGVSSVRTEVDTAPNADSKNGDAAINPPETTSYAASNSLAIPFDPSRPATGNSNSPFDPAAAPISFDDPDSIFTFAPGGDAFTGDFTGYAGGIDSFLPALAADQDNWQEWFSSIGVPALPMQNTQLYP